MTLKELLTKGEDLLTRAGKDSPRYDARALYMFLTGLDNTGLIMAQREDVAQNTQARYLSLIQQRASGIPLQHITGHQGFMDLDLKVGPEVLIPRPETELLVEEALRVLREEYDAADAPTPEVLDICTGSGAIGLSVKKHFPKAQVTLSDISDGALHTAEANAELSGLKVTILKSDMFKALEGRNFHMILCNPPYITDREIETLTEEVREHEPMIALSGGADGLDFYRILAEEAPKHLNRGGRLMMEIGYDQGETVPELMRNLGDTRVLKDLNGLDRVVIVHRR